MGAKCMFTEISQRGNGKEGGMKGADREWKTGLFADAAGTENKENHESVRVINGDLFMETRYSEETRRLGGGSASLRKWGISIARLTFRRHESFVNRDRLIDVIVNDNELDDNEWKFWSYRVSYDIAWKNDTIIGFR